MPRPLASDLFAPHIVVNDKELGREKDLDSVWHRIGEWLTRIEALRYVAKPAEVPEAYTDCAKRARMIWINCRASLGSKTFTIGRLLNRE